MSWWTLSVFCVIPFLSVGILFFAKRDLLWAAPLISATLTVLISILAMPSILSDNEHRAMFFGISLPGHLAVVIMLTAAAYLIAYILNKKKKAE